MYLNISRLSMIIVIMVVISAVNVCSTTTQGDLSQLIEILEKQGKLKSEEEGEWKPLEEYKYTLTMVEKKIQQLRKFLKLRSEEEAKLPETDTTSKIEQLETQGTLQREEEGKVLERHTTLKIKQLGKEGKLRSKVEGKSPQRYTTLKIKQLKETQSTLQREDEGKVLERHTTLKIKQLEKKGTLRSKIEGKSPKRYTTLRTKQLKKEGTLRSKQEGKSLVWDTTLKIRQPEKPGNLRRKEEEKLLERGTTSKIKQLEKQDELQSEAERKLPTTSEIPYLIERKIREQFRKIEDILKKKPWLKRWFIKKDKLTSEVEQTLPATLVTTLVAVPHLKEGGIREQIRKAEEVLKKHRKAEEVLKKNQQINRCFTKVNKLSERYITSQIKQLEKDGKLQSGEVGKSPVQYTTLKIQVEQSQKPINLQKEEGKLLERDTTLKMKQLETEGKQQSERKLLESHTTLKLEQSEKTHKLQNDIERKFIPTTLVVPYLEEGVKREQPGKAEEVLKKKTWLKRWFDKEDKQQSEEKGKSPERYATSKMKQLEKEGQQQSAEKGKSLERYTTLQMKQLEKVGKLQGGEVGKSPVQFTTLKIRVEQSQKPINLQKEEGKLLKRDTALKMKQLEKEGKQQSERKLLESHTTLKLEQPEKTRKLQSDVERKLIPTTLVVPDLEEGVKREQPGKAEEVLIKKPWLKRWFIKEGKLPHEEDGKLPERDATLKIEQLGKKGKLLQNEEERKLPTTLEVPYLKEGEKREQPGKAEEVLIKKPWLKRWFIKEGKPPHEEDGKLLERDATLKIEQLEKESKLLQNEEERKLPTTLEVPYLKEGEKIELPGIAEGVSNMKNFLKRWFR